MHWRTCSRQPRGFARYAIHRANVLKMALQFTGWQAMRPLGRVFCDRQDAGMRTSWRLRGLRAVALLMLALAWPAAASDRSEERRGGKGVVRTVRSRWSP